MWIDRLSFYMENVYQAYTTTVLLCRSRHDDKFLVY